MLKVPDAIFRSILNRLVAAAPEDPDAGLFNAYKVMLFTNDITPTRTTVKADLTAPTYTGYAVVSAGTWGGAYTDADGVTHVVGSRAQFICTTAPEEPVTVYGYGVLDSTGNTLLFAERFAVPKTVSAVGHDCPVIPEFTLSNAA